MEFTLKDKMCQMKWRAAANIKKAGKKAKEAVAWAVEHPAETSAIAVGVTTIAGGTTKVAKHISKKRAESERMRRYYDPKTFNWVTCRRELTGKEKAEFSRRREHGESVTRILESMNVLK